MNVAHWWSWPDWRRASEGSPLAQARAVPKEAALRNTALAGDARISINGADSHAKPGRRRALVDSSAHFGSGSLGLAALGLPLIRPSYGPCSGPAPSTSIHVAIHLPNELTVH